MRARRPFMKRPWRRSATRWLWRRRLRRRGNQPLALAAAVNPTFGLGAKVSWRSQSISRSSQKIARRWMRSTAPRSLRVEGTMDLPVFACTIIRIITVLLYSIPMDTISRQSVTQPLSVAGSPLLPRGVDLSTRRPLRRGGVALGWRQQWRWFVDYGEGGPRR